MKCHIRCIPELKPDSVHVERIVNRKLVLPRHVEYVLSTKYCPDVPFCAGIYQLKNGHFAYVHRIARPIIENN